jgi:integrase
VGDRGAGSLFRPKYRDKRTKKVKTAKVWWLEVWIGGKRSRLCTGLRNKTDAQKWRIQKLADLGRGNMGALHSDRVTFEDLMKMLKDDYVARGLATAKALPTRLKHLEGFFEGYKAMEITSDRVTAYVASRKKEGAAVGTINLELAHLRSGLGLAHKAGKLGAAPVVNRLPNAGIRKGFLEPEEWDAIRAQLPAHLVPLCDFYWLTGWRRTEVLNLTWEQVDFRAQVVRLEVGTTKNKEGRTFPFGRALGDVLKAQRESAKAAGTRYVFHTSDGEPIPQTTLNGAWIRACAAAGVTGRVIHDFRRTVARRMERAGVPRTVAMRLLGHKTESIYRRYAIVEEGDLREGVARLEREDLRQTEPAGVLEFAPMKK